MKNKVIIWILMLNSILSHCQDDFKHINDSEIEESIINCFPLNELPIERSALKKIALKYLKDKNFSYAFRCAELLEKFPLNHKGWCGTKNAQDEIDVERLILKSLVGLKDYQSLDEKFIPRILEAYSRESRKYLIGFVKEKPLNKIYPISEVKNILNNAKKNIEITYYFRPINKLDLDIYYFDVILRSDIYSYKEEMFGTISIPQEISPFLRNIIIKRTIYSFKKEIAQSFNTIMF